MWHPLTKKLSWAIPLMLLAGFCIAIQGGLVKYISNSLNIETIFFGRTLISFTLSALCVLPTFKKVLHEGAPDPRTKYLIVLRGICGAGSALLFYYTLEILPVSTATVFYFTFPVFVPIIGRLWLKTPIGTYMMWCGIIVALIGIGFVLQPTKITLDWRVLFGVGAGILGALGSLINRRLHHLQSSSKILFEYFWIMFVISMFWFSIRALYSTIDLYRADWLFLTVMGVSAFLFQYCFSLALRYAPARLVTPCIYFSLIFTIAIDRVYWRDSLSIWEFFGIGGIILGVILIVCAEPRESHEKSP